MAENTGKPINRLVEELKERAKELNCLYAVQETLVKPGLKTKDAIPRIIDVIPPGWQYPDICISRIQIGDKIYQSENFQESTWGMHSDVIVQDQIEGKISVYYSEEKPNKDEGPFLREERRLINTIADQLGSFLLHQRLQDVFEKKIRNEAEPRAGWQVILGLLKKTDPKLLITIARKMIHHLSGRGVKEAVNLLELFSSAYKEDRDILESNFPFQFKSDDNAINAIDEVFKIAVKYLKEDEILTNIEHWIREDQSGFLVNTLVQPGRSLTNIIGALDRFCNPSNQGLELSPSRQQSVLVSLIRRMLSNQQKYIKTAINHIEIEDIYKLSSQLIFQSGNHGKLGGKSAGLFLAAKIIQQAAVDQDMLLQVKIPKTWYIVSDALYSFLEHNNLQDMIGHKHLNLEEIRQEYPYVIHVFRNSPHPPEIIKGLSMALDDFGDVPLIVRSSSLLEDQEGTSFAGKYKSLFVANQGTKEERLTSLMGAIAEVYASLYGPDPIEYRHEHDLLNQHEEMGILIQEVVGNKIGPYYFPAFAGVAFSRNEFRWSSRIRKEDGLVRIVPGLGTRAVDRLSDDYPILAAPGQPGLQVNTTLDEIIRYSPRYIDVINLEMGTFETIEIKKLLKEFGSEYPDIKNLVSIITQDQAQIPIGLGPDFEKDNLVFTFDGLFSQSPFLELLRAVLTELQDKMKYPIDIEFAFAGDTFYLLQCRSQSYRAENIPAEFPIDIPEDKVLFTADRFISNGTIPNITHIVYIDPEQYSQLSTRQEMLNVGRAVSRLNKILTKRKFILMGPGRWGSRGDIKLGVNVTYSDINNTAVLIEVAQKRGDYTPDLSFGTHFFQDLVESSIRYIPLYPDNYGIIYNVSYLMESKNTLKEILPDFAYLEHVIRVINIKNSSDGQVLQVLMNAEKSKAIALLAEEIEIGENKIEIKDISQSAPYDEHWRWRLKSAESIAEMIDTERFGVNSVYLIGSTKNATAGPKSDIDLLIHFDGSESQKKDLMNWLEGWSLSLSQINLVRTGYKTKGLLNIILITDEDIKNRTSYAVKIGAVTDAAMPLTVGSAIHK